MSKLMTQSPRLRQEKVRGQGFLLSVQAVNFSESTGDWGSERPKHAVNGKLLVLSSLQPTTRCQIVQHLKTLTALVIYSLLFITLRVVRKKMSYSFAQ